MTRRIFLAAAAAVLSAAPVAPAQGQTTAATPVSGAERLVDDVAAARERLERERAALRAADAGTAGARRMVELGMWDEAERRFAAAPAGATGLRLAEAELRIRQHQYRDAERIVAEALRAEPGNREARLLLARLQIQAWRLEDAAATARALLERDPRDEAAALTLGRIRLLEKRYDEALEWATRVQSWNPGNPDAHLLEADVRFWNQDPAGAEAPLVRALSLDPFDADARFNYGYAIWRRVDARLLDEMAAQWNLALEVDPLHYVTHWHWGNGHTNLTYADYVQPEDSVVRERLSRADSLIARRRTPEAIALSREIEREFPQSVLPAMLRGSAYYMAWEMDRGERLDSAQATFRSILARKPNYGPAHNALAAVIKQRQFAVLAAFDSLEAEIETTPLPDDPALATIFPDVRYYPGDRVAKMVRMELGPSLAYLPLLERQGRRYRIPPLHQDLAQAMGTPYFRTATTFDNRQWMDIRGVGSGAAGIEYVERGAHQERNVLLHEYVHLFHGMVFTDAESRRVRELYHQAMEESRTLDYYASNNESEFLAQAYPAFLSPVKVHPLNHKSMNTHDDLRRKDPATYAWVDSLIAKQRRYLAGDTMALASNWAQVYVNLSEAERRARDREALRLHRATALLDTALVWDSTYVPALLSYAALERERGRFAEAEGWLARAESLDPQYAPLYAARAELVGARARAGEADPARALEERAALYRRALELERDLAERAELNRELRRLYLAHGRLPDALRVAEAYLADAPTISTYLRDRRDEAAAFAQEMRARAGYATETLPFFRELVARKPQHYAHRAQLAEALVAAGYLDEAAAALEESQRILRAGASASVAFAARIAEIRLLQGDTAAARAALAPVLERPLPDDSLDLRLVRVLVGVGERDRAERLLDRHPDPTTPRERAELDFTRGFLAEREGRLRAAERAYRNALAADPYLGEARARLARLLAWTDRGAEADAVLAGAAALELPPGPDLRRALDTARNVF